MEHQALSERVRTSLAPLDRLKEQVKGDADLELVVRRVEQIELLLEGMAELAGAGNDAERVAAGKKVAVNRLLLGESLPGWDRAKQV